VSAGQLKRLNVDEVVVATGATRTMPDLPGSDQDFVFSGDEMRAMVLGEKLSSLKKKISTGTGAILAVGAVTGATRQRKLVIIASRYWLPLGKRIVIIGGQLVGLELAEFLALRGRAVTVINESSHAGAGLYLVRRMRLLEELREHGVTLINSASEITVLDHAVNYRNYRGQVRQLAADHVVVAKGAEADLQVADELRAAGLSVHTVGDCTGVGYIEGAMHDAAKIAASL
jgi:2,4-dienoyl-CoA reductase (NADPH2)